MIYNYGWDPKYVQLQVVAGSNLCHIVHFLLAFAFVFLSTADAPAELNCSFPQPNTYQYHHIVCYENQATPTNNFC